MGADEFEVRERFEDFHDPVRVRVVVALVAGVGIDGDLPLFAHRENVHHPGVVDLEPLDVRVHLDAVQAERLRFVQVRLIVLGVLHFLDSLFVFGLELLLCLGSLVLDLLPCLFQLLLYLGAA